MRYISARVTLASAIVVASPCLAGQASFIALNTTGTSDVTMDQFGRTLVLTMGGSYGTGPIYIYEADSNSYVYIGDGAGRSLSENGTEAAGSISDPAGVQEAGRWSEGGGWQGLGQLPNGLTCPSISNGYDISADGSIVVGLGWDGCSGRAFKWTAETGMVEMEVLAGGGNRASVISADGAVAAGFASSNPRTPAYWNVADGAGVVINPEAQGEFSAINEDGTIMAGRYWDPDVGGTYLMPCYWTEQMGIVMIDSLLGFPGGHMFGMSANGRTIVGTSGIIIEGRTAMVWRPEWGSVALKDKLIELGVQGLEDVHLDGAWEVSADGTKVIGMAILPPGEGEPAQVRGFLATLPPQIDPVCDEDLSGDGQVGFTDLTQLLGTWGACPGCPEDLDGDGQVGFTDLTQLLGNWGPCA